MNERLQEMWEEATLSHWPQPGKFTAGEYDSHLEKFAELIRADEREALIRYFNGHWRSDWSDGQIIEALEARGNK